LKVRNLVGSELEGVADFRLRSGLDVAGKRCDFVPNTQQANDKTRVTSKIFLLLLWQGLVAVGGRKRGGFFVPNVQHRPFVEAGGFFRPLRPDAGPKLFDKCIEFQV
jgi:hypothetical protein